MKSRAFTLLETLVVVSIIAVLAALLTPVAIRAKEAGKMNVCAGNLKQLHTAISLYRERYDGTAKYGDCGGMGLPYLLGSVVRELDTPLEIFKCSGATYGGEKYAAYTYHVACEGPGTSLERVAEWKEYSIRSREDMILMSDPNHNPVAARLSPYVNNSYIALYLDGRIRKFVKMGSSSDYDFWKD